MGTLRLIRIKTTYWDEEDFMLITDLTDEQVNEVIQPIVDAERNNEDFYDNESLLLALEEKYPHNYLQCFTYDTLHILTF